MSSIRFRFRPEPGDACWAPARWLLLTFAATAVLPVHAATFNYEAFIAGARAGSATVNVELVENGYAVTGTAQAEGVADVFSDWRTRFHARGLLVDATPQLIEYAYVERDADQRREVTVRDGMLKYFKNGLKRRERITVYGYLTGKVVLVDR